MRISHALHRLLDYLVASLLRSDPPDFSSLPWLVRQRLQGQAFAIFCRSSTGLRWVLWLLVWDLTAQVLAWNFDLGVRAQSWLGWSAAIWAWPSLSHARRCLLARLLQQRKAKPL
jgi:hypothetical protein